LKFILILNLFIFLYL